MPIPKLHPGEPDIEPRLIRRLLAAQFPHWANLPLELVPSTGTDNAILRLGTDLAVRLPRAEWAVRQAQVEERWLPHLAPHLPVSVPQVIAQGTSGEGYPWTWAIYGWLEGENLSMDQLSNPSQTALDLAQFLRQLQQIDPTGGPPAAEANLRGLPLRHRDEATSKAIDALQNEIDAPLINQIWEEALSAPSWARPPVWLHGDLLPGNVLFRNGRLHAVIDFAGLAVGDPACDLMIAWSLLDAQCRETFRSAMSLDDATWQRGRGHALSQALIFIPYYEETNPGGVAQARRTIQQIVADFRNR